MKQSLYDILEISRDASFEDIEVAYAKRFEKLKGETSWDSNRLVMLNEAREVLSDPARRAAYDASLEASTQQPEARIHSAEIEDAPRSSAGWIIAGVIVLAVAAWWVMRDSPPPAELTGTQPPGAEAQFEEDQFETDQFELDSEEETLIVPEGDFVADATEEEILSEFEALSGFDEADIDETPAAGAVPQADTPAQIFGNWDCFDPVTGRTSEYEFAEDGSLTIRRPGSELQSFTYETSGQRVNVVDSDPPRTFGVEELAARRLVLSSGAGQRLVCSR